MDEVSRLFKSYRDGKLKLDGLTNALIKLMDEKPNFSNRAVNVLDQIQQRVPIPVTDYIEVRTEIDHACRIRINTPPAGIDGPDPDATLIFAGEQESEEQDTDVGLATRPAGQPEAAAPEAENDASTAPDEDFEATATAQHTFMRSNAETESAQSATTSLDSPEAASSVIESPELAPVEIANSATGEPEIIASEPPAIEPAPQPIAIDLDPELPETTVGVGQSAGPQIGASPMIEATNPAHAATPAQPIPAQEMESDETVIMPMAAQTPHQAASRPTASALIPPPATPNQPPAPEASADAHADEATLIAPVQQSTTAPQAAAAPSAVSAPRTAPKPPTSKTTSATQPNQRKPKSILPLIVGGCVIVGAAVIGGGLLLFGSHFSDDAPGSKLESTPTDQPQETYPAEKTDPNDPNARPMENGFNAEPEIAEPSAPEEIIEEAPTPVAKPKPKIKTLAETLNELGSEQAKLDYLFTKLQKAADTKDLLPVDRKNSATYYLVEMLKVNRHHHMISQGRAYIAQMHLEAAREARTAGKWDDAQEHLDAALEVRLPDSYMPN